MDGSRGGAAVPVTSKYHVESDEQRSMLLIEIWPEIEIPSVRNTMINGLCYSAHLFAQVLYPLFTWHYFESPVSSDCNDYFVCTIQFGIINL